jgi:hypothetical protein
LSENFNGSQKRCPPIYIFRSKAMSIEIARANMISGLQKLAEEFASSAAGLAALRSAEGLMDTETAEFIDELKRASAQLTLLANEADEAARSQIPTDRPL